MHTTHQKKAKISNGFSLTFRAVDSMKAARNAATLDEIRSGVNRRAVHRNRKAYNRRAFKRGE